MTLSDLRAELGGIDIYLLDLILKGTYAEGARILDAGCGSGRNCKWLLQNGYNVYCVDRNANAVNTLLKDWQSKINNNITAKFQVASLESLPFEDTFFDHIICSAVLHFAENHTHFEAMMSELVRVLKPDGTLFIRMTSNVGIQSIIDKSGNGIVSLPDGTERYLITQESLDKLVSKLDLSLAAPFKNVNVDNLRVMSTIVLRKN